MTLRTVKNDRIVEIDFVKGLCILCVHIGHCGINLGIATCLWQSFFMPAFFIFSGYLSKPYPSSIKKLLKSTLLLYYLWTIGLHAIMAVQYIRHGVFSASLWLIELRSIALGINQPNESAQLWFLVALFTTKAIWEIILRFIVDSRYRLIATIAIASIGIILNCNGIKATPFRLTTAMIMLPLYVFGCALSNRYDKTSFNHTHPLFMALVAAYLLGTFLNVKPFGHNVSVWEETFNIFPLFYSNAITGTATFLLLSILIDHIDNNILVRLRDIVCFFGRNSLTAFLTVNFLIYIVQTVYSKIGFQMFWSSAVFNSVVCLSVLLLQIPTAKILTKPKIARIALQK